MIRKANNFAYFLFSNFNANKDYYKILNIGNAASQTEIKKSFRELAKKHHPDSNKGNEQKFKQINEAYQVLSSQITKKDYDQVRRAQSQQNSSQSYPGSSSRSTYRQQSPYRQSTYRGYHEQQGWNNRRFREQTINQIFRQQQQNYTKNHYNWAGSKQHDETLGRRNNKNTRPNSVEDELHQAIRMEAERVKITRQSVRRAYEQEQKRREKQFKQFNSQQNQKVMNDLKDKAVKMAEGVAKNVEGMMKVGKFVKQNVQTAVKVGKFAKGLWDEFKNSNKK